VYVTGVRGSEKLDLTPEKDKCGVDDQHQLVPYLYVRAEIIVPCLHVLEQRIEMGMAIVTVRARVNH
jgi:hypothetical protein